MNVGQHARDDAGDAMRYGVLAVGHGTRATAGIAEFHSVVEQLAARLGPTPVEPSFVELAEPTIAVGLERLLDRGAEHVIVVPLLLFTAAHAKDDIPGAVVCAPVAAERGLLWTQTEPIGLDPRLVELSVQRYDEAVAKLPSCVAAEETASPISDAETLLLLVGRGAGDPAAVAEMHEFARLRAAARPVGAIEVAFTALAKPLVEQVLPRIAASKYRRIVVQPNLLFHGQLLARLQSQIAAVAATTPTKQWTTTAHFGPDRLVVEALVERITQVRQGY